MRRPRRAGPRSIIEQADVSLLDIVDNVLTKGVVITGDIMLGLADVDLVYLRVAALLCAADRLMPGGARK